MEELKALKDRAVALVKDVLGLVADALRVLKALVNNVVGLFRR